MVWFALDSSRAISDTDSISRVCTAVGSKDYMGAVWSDTGCFQWDHFPPGTKLEGLSYNATGKLAIV